VSARRERALAELREALPTTVSLATIWRALGRLQFTVKKPHTLTNVLISQRRVASGTTPNCCAMCSTSFSMSVASPPISSTGSWHRRCALGMWSCSTTSRSTNTRRFARRLKARARPLPAALQSGLQPYRTSPRQTEGVCPRGTAPHVRSRLRHHREGAPAGYTHRMRQLRAALRLSARYILMSIALEAVLPVTVCRPRLAPPICRPPDPVSCLCYTPIDLDRRQRWRWKNSIY
jgi:hypothetical protein